MIKNTCINPDDYLETEAGRVWTEKQGKVAWQKAYFDFENSLKQATGLIKVYLVYGVQGAGKSFWINNNINRIQKPVIFFDAALPAAKHRKKVVAIAKHYNTDITAVWIKASLEVAYKRNKNRSLDKQIPEQTINSVYRQLQAATYDEGFSNLIIINT